MENRPQSEVTFGGAKRRLRLGQLDIPTPEQRRVGLVNDDLVPVASSLAAASSEAFTFSWIE